MISLDKKYTSDGYPVVLYRLDGFGRYPIFGEVREPNGWVMRCWAIDGGWCKESIGVRDLKEVKKKITRKLWLNIDPDYTSSYPTKVDADKWRSNDRIACKEIEVTYEEGEGL